MGHDDVYLWNNRIMKEKDVDKYLSREFCKDNMNSLIKVIKIIILSSLGIGLGVCAYLCIKENKRPDELLKSAKTEKYQNMGNTLNTIAFDNALVRNR